MSEKTPYQLGCEAAGKNEKNPYAHGTNDYKMWNLGKSATEKVISRRNATRYSNDDD